MEVRPATCSDLPQIERLRLETFSGSAPSVWRGVPLETQLKVRLKMWQLAGHASKGLLVCFDGDQMVGTIAIGTTETTLRFAWRQLPLLYELGFVRMLRFLGTWVLTHYEPREDEAYMYSIVVVPAYRRRAAARALTESAEEQARQWGKRITSAAVARTNTPSLQLLLSMGYRLMDPPPRTVLDRVLMRRLRYVRAEKVL